MWGCRALGGRREGSPPSLCPHLSLETTVLWMWEGSEGSAPPVPGGGSGWDAVPPPQAWGFPGSPTPFHPPPIILPLTPRPSALLSPLTSPLQHQLQTQHLSHHAPPIPLTPHPSGMQPPTLAGLGSASGLLALSGVLGGAQLLTKDDRGVHDGEHRGELGGSKGGPGGGHVGRMLPFRLGAGEWEVSPPLHVAPLGGGGEDSARGGRGHPQG